MPWMRIESNVALLLMHCCSQAAGCRHLSFLAFEKVPPLLLLLLLLLQTSAANTFGQVPTARYPNIPNPNRSLARSLRSPKYHPPLFNYSPSLQSLPLLVTPASTARAASRATAYTAPLPSQNTLLHDQLLALLITAVFLFAILGALLEQIAKAHRATCVGGGCRCSTTGSRSGRGFSNGGSVAIPLGPVVASLLLLLLLVAYLAVTSLLFRGGAFALGQACGELAASARGWDVERGGGGRGGIGVGRACCRRQ
ncbi:hypothetical protein IWZ01DRAFT_235305 [Phyllosticta capitalensis]